MKSLLKKIYKLNRTIVSKDNTTCLNEIKKNYELKILKYPSGSEYASWQVPLEWNCNYSFLLDGDITLASTKDSPLFVARYSKSFKGFVTKSIIKDHLFVDENNPDCFSYEYRYAYNYNLRNSDWRISLPLKLFKQLKNNKQYYLEINSEVRKGNLLIGKSEIKGNSKFRISFLSHYCHTDQINDGLAGCLIMLEVLKYIKNKYKKPKYTYATFLFPETIGSAIYVNNNLPEIDNNLCSIFSEMGGAYSDLQLTLSRNKCTYVDRIFLYLLSDKKFKIQNFREGWGNDELIFDSPGVNVPSISIDRFPFKFYHTNHDNLENFSESKAFEVVQIITNFIDIIEDDYIPKPINRVPIYLSRFNIYKDWVHDRKNYDTTQQLLDHLYSGLSVFDISYKLKINFRYCLDFYNNLIKNNLITSVIVDPSYSRKFFEI